MAGVGDRLYFSFTFQPELWQEVREKAGRKYREMTDKVTVEDVERVAELAHLELTPEESAHMLHDLNAILDYVGELNELIRRA